MMGANGQPSVWNGQTKGNTPQAKGSMAETGSSKGNAMAPQMQAYSENVHASGKIGTVNPW